MDNVVSRLIDLQTPDLNREVAIGLAHVHLKRAVDVIEDIQEIVSEGYPEEFKYVGSAPVTPQEEFNMRTAKRGRRTIDIARNDTFLRRYDYEFERKIYSRWVAIPFARPGGLINLDDTEFHISPIVCDRTLSESGGTIFTKLIMGRFITRRRIYQYMANDSKEIVFILYSSIYNRTKKNKALKHGIKAETTLLHYLFGKWGFSETFEYLTGYVPEAGIPGAFTEEEYPSKDWVICRSVGVKPSHSYVEKEWWVPNVELAIPRIYYTPIMRHLVSGFFYLTDHFPKLIQADNLDKINMWRVALGQLIWGTSISRAKLIIDVEEHYDSLDLYVDKIMQRRFNKLNMNITNVYQLLAYIMKHFTEMVLIYRDNQGSMYDKQLNVLDYTLQPIISSITTFGFELYKKTKKGLSDSSVSRTLNTQISMDAVKQLKSRHGGMQAVVSSTDNMIFKLTSVVVAQESSDKSKKKTTGTADKDPNKCLHASLAEVNGHYVITKNDVSGRGKINPCVLIDTDGDIIRNPELVETVDRAQAGLKRLSGLLNLQMSVDDVSAESMSD